MATTRIPGSNREAVQHVLDDAVSSGVRPGIVTEVCTGDVRWFASAGTADNSAGRGRRPGELFRIGSAAKAFTAATTLTLVGDGALSLDDTVEKWLPGLLDGSHYNGDRITLRQLFRYSNTQYYLAAMMVEKLTGTSLPTTQTSIPGPHPVHYSRLELHDPAAPLHDATESNGATAWSAGGMISTTGDLLTFFSALFSGRILKPAQMEEMDTTVSTDGAGWLPNTRYGLGVWVEQKLGSGVLSPPT